MNKTVWLQDHAHDNPAYFKPQTPSLHASTVNISTLLNKSLPALIQAVIKNEKLKKTAHAVDGLIIGTGETDFTKGNTHYTLHLNERTFQLIDVPGIEGDESRYTHLIKEAVAKAHMVIYVNGTNKKPETSTAEKIRDYLEYGTQVYPLVNVRGFAEAYEFEEDRVNLDDQGGAKNALQQTVDVLEPMLGKDVLLPGHCVQGLLAFSALAYDDVKKRTTIHPSRNRNLIASQKSYFQVFSSRDDMQNFSQISAVERVIRGKVATFREDIIESNKVKVQEVLEQYLEVLNEQLAEHHRFQKRITPEFDKCRAAFDNAVNEFKRRMLNSRRNHWNHFFNTLQDKSDDIVERYFGDGDEITRRLKSGFKAGLSETENVMHQDAEDGIQELQKQLFQAVSRLLEDIQRVEFQHTTLFEKKSGLGIGGNFDLGHGLGLGDFGSIAFKIGSYALTGGTIGSAFPVVGTAIGAVIGTAVGIIMSVLDLFTSKASRIRKAQGKVREKLDDVRDQAVEGIESDVNALVNKVKTELQGDLLQKVDQLQTALKRPGAIFEQQISQITKLKNQLENMPYGTIQTVQH